MQGLKPSEEIQQEDMLRQAWDAPGSPFAGQPFDPSAVNWGGGAGGDARNVSNTTMGTPVNSSNADSGNARASSGPDYDSMIAAAQGPEERAKLQAMQAKRLSRVESMNSAQSDGANKD